MDAGRLGVFVCFMVVGIAIGTLIGAILLRAACALYNRLAGGKNSPSSVPEPELGKAMGIALVTAIVNAVIGYLLEFAIGVGAAAAMADQGNTIILRNMVILAYLLSFPVSLLVMAGMNALMLPTTFGRGILVTLCYLLVVLFVVVVLSVIFGGLYLIYILVT
jgi:hypothetical protein